MVEKGAGSYVHINWKLKQCSTDETNRDRLYIVYIVAH